MLKKVNYAPLAVSYHYNMDIEYHDGIYFYLTNNIYVISDARYDITDGRIYGSNVTKEIVDYLLDRGFEITNLNEISIK